MMQAHPVAYAAQMVLGLIALTGVAVMAWWSCKLLAVQMADLEREDEDAD